MRPSTILAGIVSLTMASAVAVPNSNKVVPRQEDQVWEDENGNTRISVSRDTIGFGNAPPWQVFDEINRHCSSTGCSPTNVMRYQSSYVIDGQSYSQDILVSVTASFADPGDSGSREQLVEVAKSVMGNTPYDVGPVTYQIGPDCPPVGVPCPPPQTATMDQYQHIRTLDIRYDHAETGFEAYMNIHVEVEQVNLGSGFCSEILTIGGTFAPLLGGIASGVFSLASLACQN